VKAFKRAKTKQKTGGSGCRDEGPKDRGRDLLREHERLGLSVMVGQPGITFTRFKPFEASRTELDSCCPQEDTGPIRFGTMMNDYREVVAVLRTVVFSCFELVYLELF
jgi:hypothetical protein